MKLWTVHSDVSFDLNTQPFGLAGAYPGMDGVPLAPCLYPSTRRMP